MRRVDLMSKTTTLVTMLSIVYALIDMKIIFLAPILTISIPYRFMKYKEEGKHTENRKILNNLIARNWRIKFIDKNLIIIVIPADIQSIITYFYSFQFIQFSRYWWINLEVSPIFVGSTNDFDLRSLLPKIRLQTIKNKLRKLFFIDRLLFKLVEVNHLFLLTLHQWFNIQLFIN